MHFKAARVSAFLVLSWSSLALAGPALDAAQRAEALAAEGKVVEAFTALGEGVDALWRAVPLSFRSVAVVESASGFGIYQERPASAFRPDDKLTVYVEPVGYGYGADQIGFSADLALENDTGQVLTEAKDAFSVSAPAPEGKREFFMTFSFSVPFVRPGQYTAIFTVRDQNSDKTGSFEVPFEIALPAQN